MRRETGYSLKGYGDHLHAAGMGGLWSKLIEGGLIEQPGAGGGPVALLICSIHCMLLLSLSAPVIKILSISYTNTIYNKDAPVYA